MLRRMLDCEEFLSDYGIRALSRYHLEHPYEFEADGQTVTVKYLPAESDSRLFGGNSNWRGPIWFPVNYMLIRSLHEFSLLWRHIQSRVPDRLRADAQLGRSGPRISRPAVQHFLARSEAWRRRAV